uniref:Uncharacterized protein n=1 Tax=Nelumbo nucifera TaxID=4432 RepID=A0A822Z0B5_NELNU|nr:TPA_asm: hypothetical protein HUJ06_007566 [Nelumbo nucifera]
MTNSPQKKKNTTTSRRETQFQSPKDWKGLHNHTKQITVLKVLQKKATMVINSRSNGPEIKKLIEELGGNPRTNPVEKQFYHCSFQKDPNTY